MATGPSSTLSPRTSVSLPSTNVSSPSSRTHNSATSNQSASSSSSSSSSPTSGGPKENPCEHIPFRVMLVTFALFVTWLATRHHVHGVHVALKPLNHTHTSSSVHTPSTTGKKANHGSAASQDDSSFSSYDESMMAYDTIMLPCQAAHNRSNGKLATGVHRISYRGMDSNGDMTQTRRSYYCQTRAPLPLPKHIDASHAPLTMIFKLGTGLEGKSQVGTTIEESSWNTDGINDDDNDDDIALDQPHTIGDVGIYKSSLFGLQLNTTMEIFVVLYNNGEAVAQVMFRAKSLQPQSWWRSSTVVHSSWTDLPSDSAVNDALFSMFDDNYSFAMLSTGAPRSSSHCDGFSGWMLYTRSGEPCTWKKPLHRLLYSTARTAVTWNSRDVDVADTLVIYAR